jgi:uncharacterized protein YukE
MAFQKKSTSNAIKTAKVRISGMKSIAPSLDLGEGMTVKAYEAAMQEAEKKIANYNTALANIGQLQNEARDSEKNLSALSERMLSLVAGRYGKTSNEYEQAGGKKRIVGARKTKKVTSELQVTATA